MNGRERWLRDSGVFVELFGLFAGVFRRLPGELGALLLARVLIPRSLLLESGRTLILYNVPCRLGRFEVRLSPRTSTFERFRSSSLGFRGPRLGLLLSRDGKLASGGVIANVIALHPRCLLLTRKLLSRLGSLGVGERLLGVGVAEALRLATAPTALR